ncbi:MAG TPA: hypothetical protein VJ372_15685 [Pyrinomonadaceae bacterium]|jgi:hypothetical protein|nr:hypothetical protein [Pyrinomonadaceae bacterium]
MHHEKLKSSGGRGTLLETGCMVDAEYTTLTLLYKLKVVFGIDAAY